MLGVVSKVGGGVVALAYGGRDRVAAMLAEVEVGTIILPALFMLVVLWEFQSRCNCKHNSTITHPIYQSQAEKHTKKVTYYVCLLMFC